MKDRLESLHARLEELADQLASARNVPRHLKDIRKQLREKQKQLRQVTRTLKKEEKDVNKLEGASVKSLFYRFLKSRERQLDIELQEYVAAALKYNACIQEIELLTFEADVLNRKLETLPEIEAEWQSTIQAKEAMIKEQFPTMAKRLSNLDNTAFKDMLQRREIEEAIIAGVQAKTYLKSLAKYLQRISGWGMWPDGVGRYAPYAKKSLIDKARQKAIQADLALHQFDVELSDVFKKLEIAHGFSIDAFQHFLDIFYNNLITDWIVRRNLKHTINNVQSALDSVERYLVSLRKEKKQIEAGLKKIEQEKEDLIYNTR